MIEIKTRSAFNRVIKALVLNREIEERANFDLNQAFSEGY